jgi:hypothetical protein
MPLNPQPDQPAIGEREDVHDPEETSDQPERRELKRRVATRWQVEPAEECSQRQDEANTEGCPE